MESSLADDCGEDFKGATLRISSDLVNLNNGSEESDTESVAKLVLSPNNNSCGNVNLPANENARNSIWSGSDVVSPIASIPRRVSQTLWRSDNESTTTRTDIMVSKPFENENPQDFFSFRDGLVENAVHECIRNLRAGTNEEEILGSWLLTEISLWDNEKERLILLTDRSLITVKYDFIALKQLEFRQVALGQIDTIVNGELVYPPASLVPRINGLANGVTSIVRDCIVERWSHENATNKSTPHLEFSNFEPRNRGMQGIRLMWNDGKPLTFTKRWNPFTQDIPFNTYASHPLFWHKDCDEVARKTYDVDDFREKVAGAVDRARGSLADNNVACKIHHKPIVLQNYVGLGSIIHNKNALGFFKVRGKFSF